jgi:hypothetical protein
MKVLFAILVLSLAAIMVAIGATWWRLRLNHRNRNNPRKLPNMQPPLTVRINFHIFISSTKI